MAPHTPQRSARPGRVEGWRGTPSGPFPAPARSNGANGFPVRRSPVRFASRVMRPIALDVLSRAAPRHPVVVIQPERRVDPRATPPFPAEVSLRLDVQPPPQVLQTDGRHCQAAPAFHVAGGLAEQQGPFAPRALPRLLATPGPSVTLSSAAHFPGALVIGPPCFRRFRRGTRRASPVARRVLVTVPSLPPRRRGPAASTRLRPALLPSCASQALGLRESAHCRGYPCVHSRYGPATRSPSS